MIPATIAFFFLSSAEDVFFAFAGVVVGFGGAIAIGAAVSAGGLVVVAADLDAASFFLSLLEAFLDAFLDAADGATGTAGSVAGVAGVVVVVVAGALIFLLNECVRVTTDAFRFHSAHSFIHSFLSFVSFRFVSFRFVPARFVSFRSFSNDCMGKSGGI